MPGVSELLSTLKAGQYSIVNATSHDVYSTFDRSDDRNESKPLERLTTCAEQELQEITLVRASIERLQVA
jgi:hypothetical protein